MHDFEFEFIPLTCLYQYYEAYFILYDIFLKDFLLDSFLLQFKNMFYDLSDIIHQLSTYTKHSDTHKH